MKKINLIWIYALVLVIYSVGTNAWADCAPTNCSSGYTDNGVVCEGSICTRNCTINVCDSSWTEVYSDTSFGWNEVAEDELSDSSGSYAPNSTQYCYNFTYDGPTASR